MRIESPDPERLLDVLGSVYAVSGIADHTGVEITGDHDPDLVRWVWMDWPELVTKPPVTDGDGGMSLLLDTGKTA
jgi:hypothetical protein